MALAAVPAAFGALLLLAGDRPSTGTTRLHATQGPAAAPQPAPPASTAADLPLVPAGEATPTTLGIIAQAVAAALGQEAPPTSAPPSTSTSGGEASTAPAASDSSATPRATSGESPAVAAPPATATTTAPPATTAPPTTTTTTTTAPPKGPVRAAGVEADVVPLTNADRTAHGLGSLSRNGCLDGVASRLAEQLARSGVLTHNPGAAAGIRDCRPDAAWGDNVGTSLPCSAPVLEEKWMASPSHRRNILTGEFRSIGVGAWTDAAGACWVQVLFSS